MENPSVALFLLAFTVLSFSWVFYVKDTLRKICICLLAVFVYIYCGLGVGYADRSYFEYEVYYCLYVLILSLSIRFFYKRDFKLPVNEGINRFSDKFGGFIIAVYYIIIMMPLIQGGNIGLLVSPPAPNLVEHFSDVDFSENQVSGIFDSIKNFISPLFYLSLTRYIKKPKILIPLLLFPQYVIYCNASYMGRGSMAFFLIFIFIYIYLFFPNKRKTITLAAFAGIPGIIVFFAAYVFIRQGVQADTTSFLDGFNFLIQSETYYYSWYYDIIGDAKYLLNYIVWFITLPLPGFLKPFNMNFSFNALFTMEVMGMGSLTDVKSILLPGLVNESIFIFGRQFFFLHAILFGWVYSFVFNTLSKNIKNILPLLYIMLELSIQCPRGGTSGPYSDALKLLFIYFIFYFFSGSSKKKIITE